MRVTEHAIKYLYSCLLVNTSDIVYSCICIEGSDYHIAGQIGSTLFAFCGCSIKDG